MPTKNDGKKEVGNMLLNGLILAISFLLGWGGEWLWGHYLGGGEDDPKATSSSSTKVWVEGGGEGVNIRAAIS
jgi:hypothetical protein